MELGLSLGFGRRDEEDEEEAEEEEEDEEDVVEEEKRSCNDLPVQLSLLPFSPVPRQHLSAAAAAAPQLMGFPWLTENNTATRGVDVNLIPTSLTSPAEGALSGSPNSTVSSFHVECAAAGVIAGGEGEAERALSRASDEEEGNARKKLRLSKEQSAYLEESFKEHNTLNPKQKVALAKQLNLRPRQVEVWFQNRRARTKLKQTEVDCEYLKRCCETLTEENRRLQKELSELRALKTPSHPFYMQLPATTLSMCPSCERTTTTTTSAAAPANPTTALATATTNTGQQQSNKSNTNTTSFGSLFAAKNRFYPFAPHPTTSPAS